MAKYRIIERILFDCKNYAIQHRLFFGIWGYLRYSQPFDGQIRTFTDIEEAKKELELIKFKPKITIIEDHD